MFADESKRVEDAITGDGQELLALLPGKHLLSILANCLGLKSTALTSMVLRSLSRNQSNKGDSVTVLGEKIEAALLAYLPPRRG